MLDPSDPTQLNGQRDINIGKSLKNMESATLTLEKACKTWKARHYHWKKLAKHGKRDVIIGKSLQK